MDLSLKETSISVRQNRNRIWRGKCPSHPRAAAEAIRKHAADAVLAVFETGPSQLVAARHGGPVMR